MTPDDSSLDPRRRRQRARALREVAASCAQAGYEVIEAASGDDALRLVAERAPRLVLLDVQPARHRRLGGVPADQGAIRRRRPSSCSRSRPRTCDEEDTVRALEGGADALAHRADRARRSWSRRCARCSARVAPRTRCARRWRASRPRATSAEAREPHQGRVPGDALARAALAAQRDPHLGRRSLRSGRIDDAAPEPRARGDRAQHAPPGEADRGPARRLAHHLGQAAPRDRARRSRRGRRGGARERAPRGGGEGHPARAQRSTRPLGPVLGRRRRACSRSSGTCSRTRSSSRPRAAGSRCASSASDSQAQIEVTDSGRGHRPGVPAAHLRALPPGGLVDDARGGRARPRPRHRAPPGRAARRHGRMRRAADRSRGAPSPSVFRCRSVPRAGHESVAGARTPAARAGRPLARPGRPACAGARRRAATRARRSPRCSRVAARTGDRGGDRARGAGRRRARCGAGHRE